MEKVNQVLAFVFYLVWIPLGLVLIAFIIYLIVANPLGMMTQGFGGPGGGGYGGPPSFNDGGGDFDQRDGDFGQRGPGPQ